MAANSRQPIRSDFVRYAGKSAGVRSTHGPPLQLSALNTYYKGDAQHGWRSIGEPVTYSIWHGDRSHPDRFSVARLRVAKGFSSPPEGGDMLARSGRRRAIRSIKRNLQDVAGILIFCQRYGHRHLAIDLLYCARFRFLLLMPTLN